MNKSTLGQYGKKLLTIAKIIYLEAEDIEIITPEEYDMVFGGDEDG